MAASVVPSGDNVGTEIVPSWLRLPPGGQVPPPVVTRAQSLPLDCLTWENFERLCLRLVDLESDIEHCQAYGIPGQGQEGIDLYARLKAPGPTYVVYQCKRVKDFGPGDIKKATKKFLDGTWVASATQLTLCTSESLSNTDRSEELERQAALLKQQGVELVPWDLDAISKKLKDHPDIVDDFFGRPWVAEFCGDEVASALGPRLDRSKVEEFRRRLGQFYSRIFNIQDPGLPATLNAATNTIRLSDRYVVPDILSTESVASLVVSQPPVSGEQGQAPKPAESDRVRSAAFERQQRTREGLEGWLSQAKRAVVLGSPGGGKSALLKFIVLDLFSSSPTLPRLATAWGRLLPIWLPFAFWSRLIEDRGAQNASIDEAVKAWLSTWGEADLWPLVSDALKDRRLLLLIDGLDEWSSELSGRMGLQVLQNVVESADIPAIVTCRPAGFRRVTLQSASWRIGELAPLSDTQREVVSRRWFSAKGQEDTAGGTANSSEPLAELQTARFIAELKSRPELDILSRTPLFLLLLIYLKFQQVVLPRRRFDAYEALVDQLVRVRPVENRAAAQTIPAVRDELSSQEVRDALAYVAFWIQRSRPTGIIDQADLQEAMEEYLKDVDVGLGLDPPLARRHAVKLADVAEGAVGVLVRQGVKELSFFHRCILEHLSAVHAGRLSHENQCELVRDCVIDVRWHEVILGLISITKRPVEVARLISEVQKVSAREDDVGRSCMELLAEVAFSDIQCPPALARQVAMAVLETVRDHEWLPHRERLVPHVVEGLRSTRVRGLVSDFVRPWLFSGRDYALQTCFAAIATWPLDELTITTCKAGSNSEDASAQREALASLALVGKGDETTKKFLRTCAERSLDENRRAAALEVYATTWPSDENVEELIKDAQGSPSFVVRYAATATRVRLGVHSTEDRDFLLFLARSRTVLPYKWSGSVAECLVLGWPGDPEVKRQALEAVSKMRDADAMDRDIAYRVLLSAFAGDQDVGNLLVRQFEDERFPLLSGDKDLWFLAAAGFAGRADLTKAVDNWATRERNSQYHPMELVGVSDLGTPDVMRKALLSSMKGSFPHWAAEVLARRWWGKDPEVSEALKAIVASDRAPDVARIIPVVLPKEEARRRLLEILADPKSSRFDMAATMVVELMVGADDSEAVDALIAAYNRTSPDDWSRAAILARLVETCPQDGRVKEAVARTLDDDDAPMALFVRAYRDDVKVREKCARRMMPVHRSLRARLVEEIATRLEPADVMEWLRGYDSERDADIKVQAARAFSRAVKALDQEADALPALREAIGCYGFDYEERRQAAFVGLLELGRLDVLGGMQETIGKGEPLRIPTGSRIRQSRTLYRAIAEHWPKLEPERRDDLVRRLDSDGDFWSRMAAVAAEYPHMHQEVLGRLRGKGHGLSAELQFKAVTRPRSAALKDICMTVLDMEPPRNWPEIELQARASRTFAEQFPSDVGAIAAALAPLSAAERWHWPGKIETLCLLDPRSEIVTELFQQANAERRQPMPVGAYYPVMLARIPVARVVEFVMTHALRARAEPFNLRTLAYHLVKRVRGDRDLRDALAQRADQAQGGEQICLLQVLTAVPGPDDDLASLARKRLREEMAAPFSSFDVDIFSGEVRAVVLSLWSLLESLTPWTSEVG